MIALRAPRNSEVDGRLCAREAARVPCAGANTIAALLAGANDPDLEAHLDACDDCRRLVADLGRGLSRIGAAPARGLPVVGERLGRFEIVRVIGAGGMGVVYEARDAVLDRTVALKLMRPDLVDAHALLAEAQAMAKLQHGNVAIVHEAGELDGHSFVCMEYVAGPTLRGWLRERRTLDEILDAFVAAGRGLAYVHAAGMVHFDFKPDNVLIGRGGRVVVSDFGLARAAGHRGLVIGTPAYMAPEQRRGERSDARADQYAFCIALREAVGTRAPRWLARVIARGLAERARDRHASMDALLAAIVSARQRRRHWRRAAVLAVTAVAALVALPGSSGKTTTVTHVIDRPVIERVVEPAAPAAPGATTASSASEPGGITTSESRAVGRSPGAAAPIVPGAASRSARSGAALLALASTLPVAANAPGSSPAPSATMLGATAAPGDCDDGTPRTCPAMPLACPQGSVLAVQNGCWTCADDHTCAPLGLPRACADGSRLACSLPRPDCGGHEVAIVRGGCWQCSDPFSCGGRAGAPPPPQAPPQPKPTPHGPTCGNGMCEIGEDHVSCPVDCCELSGAGSGSGGCVATCGNGMCEIGEDHTSCPSDCCAVGPDGNCLPVCGNGMCETGEDPASCPGDCH
jgi:serine/threonine-protein kinase